MPTALDLPDVSAADVTPPSRPTRSTSTLTRADKRTPAATPVPTGVDPDVAEYL